MRDTCHSGHDGLFRFEPLSRRVPNRKLLFMNEIRILVRFGVILVRFRVILVRFGVSIAIPHGE